MTFINGHWNLEFKGEAINPFADIKNNVIEYFEVCKKFSSWWHTFLWVWSEKLCILPGPKLQIIEKHAEKEAAFTLHKSRTTFHQGAGKQGPCRTCKSVFKTKERQVKRKLQWLDPRGQVFPVYNNLIITTVTSAEFHWLCLWIHPVFSSWKHEKLSNKVFSHHKIFRYYKAIWKSPSIWKRWSILFKKGKNMQLDENSSRFPQDLVETVVLNVMRLLRFWGESGNCYFPSVWVGKLRQGRLKGPPGRSLWWTSELAFLFFFFLKRAFTVFRVSFISVVAKYIFLCKFKNKLFW